MVLLGIGAMLDRLCEKLEVKCGLSQLELSNRLSLLNVACVIARSIALSPLRSLHHTPKRVLLQAIAGTIAVVRLRKQRNSVVRCGMGVVPEHNREGGSRPRQPFAPPPTEDGAQSIPSTGNTEAMPPAIPRADYLRKEIQTIRLWKIGFALGAMLRATSTDRLPLLALRVHWVPVMMAMGKDVLSVSLVGSLKRSTICKRFDRAQGPRNRPL